MSPACDNCYAAGWAARSGLVEWGRGEPRRRTSPAYWQQPFKWERQPAQAGARPRVTCASLADVFDAEVPGAWRTNLWALIRETPHVAWLLLTKRPSLIRCYLPGD